MNATLAGSAAPPHAVLIWTSGRDILIEIPGSATCPPCVLRFPLHESGLSKALALFNKSHLDFAGQQLTKPLHHIQSDPRTAHAAAVLARMGVIKP